MSTMTEMPTLSPLAPHDANAPHIRRTPSKDDLMLLSQAASSMRPPTVRQYAHSMGTPPKKRRTRSSAKSPAPPPTGIHRLKMLAVAFKLCPAPDAMEIASLSEYTSVPVAELESWFARRRMLEKWVQRHPDVTASELGALWLLHGAQSSHHDTPATATG